MVGGRQSSCDRMQTILQDIAARYDQNPCVAWLGEDDAGHFVKTVHNGIEYADMQMIAEIYGILRDGLQLPASEIANLFARWNKGRLNSYLIEITAKVLDTTDSLTGKLPVGMIIDKAGQKGMGKWAVIEAQNLGVAATSIEAAEVARLISSQKMTRQRAAGILALPSLPLSIGDRTAFFEQLDRRCSRPKLGLIHKPLQPSPLPHGIMTGSCQCRPLPASDVLAVSYAQRCLMR